MGWIDLIGGSETGGMEKREEGRGTYPLVDNLVALSLVYGCKVGIWMWTWTM